MSATSEPRRLRINAATQIAPVRPALSAEAARDPDAPLGPPDPRTAYRVALATEEARGPSLERFAGHRLYWMSGGASVIGACDLAQGDDRFLVVGRHTHADVVLERDPRVSLRHLLLRSVGLADAPPMLSVLDLSSTLGFHLVDGSRQRAISASGPVVFTVGAYAFVALPTGVPPAELPEPRIVPLAVPDARAQVPPGHPYRSPANVTPRPRELRDSVVSLMPWVRDLAEPADARCTNAHGAAVELEVRSGLGREHVALSRAELTHGVLLGRSPKCIGLGRVLRVTTSRVHALLLETRTGLVALDMGSTHGLFDAHGRRRRIVPLNGAIERIHLGEHDVEVVVRRCG